MPGREIFTRAGGEAKELIGDLIEQKIRSRFFPVNSARQPQSEKNDRRRQSRKRNGVIGLRGRIGNAEREAELPDDDARRRQSQNQINRIYHNFTSPPRKFLKFFFKPAGFA